MPATSVVLGMRPWVVALGVVLTACSSQAAGTPATAPTTYETSAVASPGSAVNCAVADANAELALVTTGSAGQSTVTLYDASDAKNPKAICNVNGASAGRFISSHEISFLNASNQLLRLKLAAATMQLAVDATGIRTFGWSQDGSDLAYVTNDGQLWLKRGTAAPTVIAGPPSVHAVDFAGYAYQVGIQFSPSGRYLFDIDVSGLTMRVFDSTGTQVWSAAPETTGNFTTMATWDHAADKLYFRDAQGVHVWAPGAGETLVYPALPWFDPSFSPDGIWVAYTVRDVQSQAPHVEIRQLSSGSVLAALPGLRSHPVFVGDNVLWDQEEQLGSGFPASTPTGKVMAIDLATRQETTLTISDLPSDVWPR